MKHLLWATVAIIVALLAFGPVWLEEYDAYNLRHSDATFEPINPPAHGQPSTHNPYDSGDSDNI